MSQQMECEGPRLTKNSFRDLVQDISWHSEPRLSLRAAYDLAEARHLQEFGKRRYLNFDAWKSSYYRRRKRK